MRKHSPIFINNQTHFCNSLQTAGPYSAGTWVKDRNRETSADRSQHHDAPSRLLSIVQTSSPWRYHLRRIGALNSKIRLATSTTVVARVDLCLPLSPCAFSPIRNAPSSPLTPQATRRTSTPLPAPATRLTPELRPLRQVTSGLKAIRRTPCDGGLSIR